MHLHKKLTAYRLHAKPIHKACEAFVTGTARSKFSAKAVQICNEACSHDALRL